MAESRIALVLGATGGIGGEKGVQPDQEKHNEEAQDNHRASPSPCLRDSDVPTRRARFGHVRILTSWRAQWRKSRAVRAECATRDRGRTGLGPASVFDAHARQTEGDDSSGDFADEWELYKFAKPPGDVEA